MELLGGGGGGGLTAAPSDTEAGIGQSDGADREPADINFSVLDVRCQPANAAAFMP